ncbi:nucleotide sugar dehydrogenase [Halorussus litoreus]|uniref:nucleotide sugar dehydrogenase n=1 Tax=Halorussus litoreus TaxID=1710536 RepID=UPI000E26C0FD|nr:nucleotide sugar dehydrogenase [Halorussus litoreus]
MSRVCVHGLGYIGLPTAAMLTSNGHEVVGFDTSERVLDRIERLDLQFDEPELRSLVSDALDSGDLVLATEPETADYHLVCVPTPLDASGVGTQTDNRTELRKRADLSAVEAASDTIADELRPGDTVIVESTVPPGTTAETVRPILEASGLTAGEDFRLAYSPETVLPGDVARELRENDRIVGGVDDGSTRSAVELYDSFVDATVYTTTATTAEFAKLAQNTFRDVNIALANEFAKLARDYGIESREAIRLGNTHPRVDIHRPGPGVGGHCVPVDPWFLAEHSDRTELLECARRVNDGMVGYVVELVRSHLGDLDGRRIAVLGVAYKGNVADVRQSPTLRLAHELVETGADASFHDPHVEADSVAQSERVALSSLSEATANADAVVIMTDHDEYRNLDPQRMAERMRTPVMVDTKAMIDRDAWTDSGFDVSQV